jgi:hypothetical protein
VRLFAVVPLIVLCGCPKKDPPPPPVEPAKPVARAVEDDCTFDTKLVPGVPGSPGHLIASERNPNGDSELAAHMRTMVDDLKDARAKVLAGQPVAPLKAKHRKIRCAWPTSLSDRTPAFDAMAQAYLVKVAELDAKPADVKAAYTGVVAACRACHEQTCDGPIAVIDGLGLDAK